MKSEINQVVEETHDNYEEFDRWQYIATLDIGDKVEIKVVDVNGKQLAYKEFTTKYINAHINCQWQDKGVKTIPE